jgi:hypothetical protein
LGHHNSVKRDSAMRSPAGRRSLRTWLTNRKVGHRSGRRKSAEVNAIALL